MCCYFSCIFCYFYPGAARAVRACRRTVADGVGTYVAPYACTAKQIGGIYSPYIYSYIYIYLYILIFYISEYYICIYIYTCVVYFATFVLVVCHISNRFFCIVCAVLLFVWYILLHFCYIFCLGPPGPFRPGAARNVRACRRTARRRGLGRVACGWWRDMVQ